MYKLYTLIIILIIVQIVVDGFIVMPVSSSSSKMKTASTIASSSPVKKKMTNKVLSVLPPEVEHLLNSNPALKDFERKVYEYCSRVPMGKVTTYKKLAEAIGSPSACRAVGSALRKNPFAPTVPCHRVVATDRSLGGFYGSKDMNGSLMKKKIQMLKDEGILLDDEDNVKKVKVALPCIYTFPL